jgi:hypothetical protein
MKVSKKLIARDMHLLSAYCKHRRKLDDALAVNIKVEWHVALEIVVNDLIEKYKHNVEAKNKEWSEAFKKVLSYYLDESEMKELEK